MVVLIKGGRICSADGSSALQRGGHPSIKAGQAKLKAYITDYIKFIFVMWKARPVVPNL